MFSLAIICKNSMLCVALILRDVKGAMEFNDLMVGQMELAFSEETWQRYSHPIYQRFLGSNGWFKGHGVFPNAGRCNVYRKSHENLISTPPNAPKTTWSKPVAVVARWA